MQIYEDKVEILILDFKTAGEVVIVNRKIAVNKAKLWFENQNYCILKSKFKCVNSTAVGNS